MGLEEEAPAAEPAAPGRALQAELGLVAQPRAAAQAAADSGFGPYETVTDAAALARWVEAARAAGMSRSTPRPTAAPIRCAPR